MADDGNTFNIPACNIEALERKLTALVERASKLGLTDALNWTKGEPFEVEQHTGRGNHHTVEYVPVTVEAAGDIKLPGGWQLVAVLDHRSADTPIILSVPGAGDLPLRYRLAGPDCDHCKIDRRRNDTFIIRAEASEDFLPIKVVGRSGYEYRQVGRTCIADYLGHKDALAIASSFQTIATFIEGLRDEEGEFYRRTPTTWKLTDMLAFVSAIIRESGWVPRSQKDTAHPTADAAWGWFSGDFEPIKVTGRDGGAETVYPPAVEERDIETARLALDWLATATFSGNNNYIYNLQTIAHAGWVTERTIGLAASIVSTYKRQVERDLRYAAERKERDNGHVSEFVGTEGERLHGLTITVLGTYESEGDYGLTTRVVFKDEAGNDFVWFASGSPDFEQGESYTVNLTVKRHNEYRGRKQTQVNRMARAK